MSLNAFCWRETFVFWLKCHWRLFSWLRSIIAQHWTCWKLATGHVTSRWLSRSPMSICIARSQRVHSHIDKLATVLQVEFLNSFRSSLMAHHCRALISLLFARIKFWTNNQNTCEMRCLQTSWRPCDLALMRNYNLSLLSVDITMTSQWVGWRLKSPASGLFTQPFIRAQIKENIKAPRHWPLCGNSPGTGEFPAQMASNSETVSIWWRHHEWSVE